MAVSEQGKTRAIVAHITVFGLLIAAIMNNNETKDEFASFYIRQMLGVFIAGVAVSAIGAFIPGIGIFLPLVVVVLWIMSLISAIQGEKKPLPIIGDKFQDWFATM